MNTGAQPTAGMREHAPLEGYYRLHSCIYDATRWSFLFGRSAILGDVARVSTPARVLEVGCGTGRNLMDVCRKFPQAEVAGVDLSESMLDIARRKTERFRARVRLTHCAYGPPFAREGEYDLVLFSYALTMFNPGFEEAIATAHGHLAEGGHIAVVDFHDTRWRLFERWMGVNHVRMNGQLRPFLKARFAACNDRLHTAYGGIWRYLAFVGRK